MRVLSVLLIAILIYGNGDSLSETQISRSFQSAYPGYIYRFPHDHGTHDDFRTEWWYYTGHLIAAGGRRFGYQLTFFRRALDVPQVQTNPSRWSIRHLYLGHAGITDVDHQRFRYAEKVSRAGLGKAGAEPDRLHVWIDRWSAESMESNDPRHHLRASTDDFSLDLTVTPEKPPITHGKQGVSLKGSQPGQASHYYSITRLLTSGTITLDGRQFPVTGISWMDHEFGSGDLGDEMVGWDWFSIQLKNDVEVMLYHLRRADGQPDPMSSGTVIFPDGRTQHLALEDFRIDVLDQWTSRTSGTRYPGRWRVSIPSQDLTLELSPRLADQELITGRSTQITYWEGAVAVEGKAGPTAVDGQGYVELTGYAERFHQKL
jgi:predicted secreted hydrolase